MEKEKQARSSKIRKLSSESSDHACTTAPCVDRLSGLPDDVICHILSFLPTKKSVRTCILAKRWKSMWGHVPSLVFDRDYDFSGVSSMDMSLVMSRVMLLRKGVNINTFHLNHMGSCISFEFETWIATCIAHNVQNLHIFLDYQFCLPQCLFSCKTLVDLRLGYCRVDIPNTDTVEFPSLKKLRLEEVMYESDSTLDNILSGCPVLEELIIVMQSSTNALACCNVSSVPTLKRLDINSDFDYVDNTKWYEVKLNTPELTYLRLHDFVSDDFSPGALTSVVEADVHFGAGRDVVYSLMVLKFVGAICNVKCLKLATCLMKVDDSAFSAVLSIIKFHNLTDLVLEADWRFVSFFLENAENLQVLAIRMVDCNVKYWMEPDEVPVCVSSHLRKVTIRGFGFTVGEFELVRYFFRSAKVMKYMEIYLDQINEEKELDAVKRISKYHQGFEACELVFH